MRVLLATIGALLLVAGVALGAIIPTSAVTSVPASLTIQARVDTYSCGSPWSINQDSIDHEQSITTMAAEMATVQGFPTVAENATDLCTRALGTRGAWGAVLGVLGALTLLGVGLVLAMQRPKRPPVAEA